MTRAFLRAGVLCIIVWGLLYLPHLRTSPPWYGDETVTLMIGRTVFSGNSADRSMHPTFWHSSYAYQPLYAWAVGGAAWVFERDIYGARLLNAILALIVAIVILLLGRNPFGIHAALFGALTFLTYSQSVVHFRWIYPHNAVALGFVIVVLCLLRRSAPKPDWIAGFGLATAAACHPLFVHGAVAACLCRIRSPLSWLRMAVFPTLIISSTIGWTLFRQSPQVWVLEDILNLAGFYAQFSRDHGSGFQPILNTFAFFTQDFFHLGAFICALLCFWRKFYAIPVFIGVVSGLLLQNRQNLTLFYYQAVVFLPLMALAWAGAFRLLECVMRRLYGRQKWVKLTLAALWFIPAYQFSQAIVPSITGNIVPRNSHWVTQDFQEVEAAADWMNSQLEPNDLVICHQNIGWLINCRTADLMQVTAWNGRPTFSFEQVPSRDRFIYQPNPAEAKFLVLGDIDQRWTLGQPNVALILEEVTKSSWPVVWRGSHYLILANPEFWKR